jgi:hypothetical protein
MSMLPKQFYDTVRLEAWLLGRGVRTLFHRVTAACDAAERIAHRLEDIGHPAISSVSYPGLPSHPGHNLAKQQMSGRFGNMLSLRMAEGEDAARALMLDVQLWRAGTSFGGVQSILEHRASVEANYPPTPKDLVRLSVGLEDSDDLFNDLLQAFGAFNRNKLTVSARRGKPPPAFEGLAEVLALRAGDLAFLVGSASRSFLNPRSDIDLLLVTPDEEYAQRFPPLSPAYNGLPGGGFKMELGDQVLDVSVCPRSFLDDCVRSFQDAGDRRRLGLMHGCGDEAIALLLSRLLSGKPLARGECHEAFARSFPTEAFAKWRYFGLSTLAESMLNDARAMTCEDELESALLRVRSGALHIAWAYLIKNGRYLDREKWVFSSLKHCEPAAQAERMTSVLRSVQLETGPTRPSIENSIRLCSEMLGYANEAEFRSPRETAGYCL